jgi:hypothetical protein
MASPTRSASLALPAFALIFSNSQYAYIFSELELRNLEELVEAEAKIDLTLMQRVFCLGYIFGDLLFGFKDGFGKRLDRIEKLDRDGCT